MDPSPVSQRRRQDTVHVNDDDDDDNNDDVMEMESTSTTGPTKRTAPKLFGINVYLLLVYLILLYLMYRTGSLF